MKEVGECDEGRAALRGQDAGKYRLHQRLCYQCMVLLFAIISLLLFMIVLHGITLFFSSE